MKHGVFSIRDTCVQAFHLPMVFQNRAGAVRALGDAVNRPGQDNAYFQHPEHYQWYEIGSFDDETGVLEPLVPEFVVDCQSLVKAS